MSNKAKFDFTAREFDTNLRSLIEVVRNRAPESWNSFQVGDLGMVVLDIIAYNYDQLSFLMDMQAQECFLPTLRQRESIINFASLVGYTIRRNAPASVEVYCQASSTPLPQEIAYVIPAGTKVRSKDGQIWEVLEERQILPGSLYPVVQQNVFGNVIGSYVDEVSDQEIFEPALVRIDPGSAVVQLVAADGTRFPSEVNFGNTVSRGSILVLTDRWDAGTAQFVPAPPFPENEYAILDIGKEKQDIFDNSVLYLDRPWSGEQPFIGKWRVENRNIVLTQGETKDESFTVPSGAERRGYTVNCNFFPVISTSDNRTIPSGFFASGGNTTFTDIGVRVTVNGESWYATSSLLFEGPNSKTYEVSFDQLDRMTIRFGDGVFGQLVPENAVIEVNYRVGGGAVGNVPQNLFDTSVQIVSFAQPSLPVSVYLSNPYTVGVGGTDRESIEQAKRSLPNFVRSNDRAVSGEDYAFLASNFSDPSHGAIALAVGVVHKNLVPKEQNIIWVYSWVKGANGQLYPPSLPLKSALRRYLEDRKMSTDEVVVVDGISTHTPLHIRYKFTPSADPADVLAALRFSINSVFQAQRPGNKLYLSALYEAAESVEGLEYVNIFSPGTDLNAESDHELFINTVTPSSRTALNVRALRGSSSIEIRDPDMFSPSQFVSIFEAGKIPATLQIESVVGNVLNLREALPSTYSTDADITAGDFLVDYWSFEKKVNLFIRFVAPENNAQLTRAVHRAVNQYFKITLKPGESLKRSKITEIVESVQDVYGVRVNLEFPESEIEIVSAGSNELLVIGVISINDNVLQPIPEL